MFSDDVAHKQPAGGVQDLDGSCQLILIVADVLVDEQGPP
jgi:hypothetical protein